MTSGAPIKRLATIVRDRRMLAAVVVLCACLSAVLISGTEAKQKLPIRAIDITAALPPNFAQTATVQQVRSTSDTFYVSVSPAPNARNSVIVSIDAGLNVRSILRLPSAHELQDFDVDDKGVVYALQDQFPAAKSTILSYRPDGSLRSTTAVPYFATRMCHVDGKLVLLKSGVSTPELQVFGGDGSALSIPIQIAALRPELMALRDKDVLLAERRPGMIHIIDAAGGIGPSFKPVAPSIPAAFNPATPEMQPGLNVVAFSSAAVSPQANIYLLAGHYRLSAGAPVASFNAKGSFINSFRCTMPTFKGLVSVDNPGGYMFATKVALNANAMLLVSADAKAAVYNR